ncbi:MAG: glycoside hydrolase domain-containing protein [Bacteroidota bacterium]
MKAFLYFAACFFCLTANAQDLSYSKPGKQFYKELPNPVKTDLAEWAKLTQDVTVRYASDNIKYPKEKVPTVTAGWNWEVKAWKGEKVQTQVLVWTKKNIPTLRCEVSALVSEKGSTIAAKNVKAAFVRYTMSDVFDGGCSHGPQNKYDSFLVADPIDIIDKLPVDANTVQPIWLSVEVPANTPEGKYTGTLTVVADKKYELKITVAVLKHTLPPPSQWKYDFDIWQYPAPIARIHDVPLWSEEHFKLMRGYYTYLANAGQKVVTANIIEQPWGLDHVHFDDPSLVTWTKKKNGTWDYDFSKFDRYVSFVMSCGINQRINCYSMITWDLSFIYYDETMGKNNTIKLKPGTQEYRDFWLPMLTRFTAFLKTKGWFSKTTIAMDERPVESMQAVIALLKEIDPAWKIALAGDTYHPEIEKDIYDYCLASYLDFDDTVLKQRRVAGKPTTYYTACPEEYPNGYTFSPPAENTWLGWHAAAKGLTGYLFWAYNTWVANPLIDSRWRRYPAGELFQFYPGPRTSIRFEKLVEGIRDFEKIRILKEYLAKQGNQKGLAEIDEAVAGFQLGKLKTIPAAEMVSKAKAILNKF